MAAQNKSQLNITNLSVPGQMSTMQGTLGQYTVILNGKLCITGSEWDLNGDFEVKDFYNFNPQPLFGGSGNTRRTLSGELKTRWANSNLDGQGFPITSQRIKLSQSSDQQEADWSGKGKAQPNAPRTTWFPPGDEFFPENGPEF